MKDIWRALAQSRAASAAAATATGGRASKLAKAKAELCQLQSTVQLGTAALQLLHALNTIWPGQAGILSSQAAAPSAVLAVHVANALLSATANGVHWDGVSLESAEESIPCVVQTTLLLAQRLHSRLDSRCVNTLERGLLESASLLQLVSLLWAVSCYHNDTAASCSCSARRSLSDTPDLSTQQHAAAVPDSGSSSFSTGIISNSNTIGADPPATCLICRSRRELLIMLKPDSTVTVSETVNEHIRQIAIRSVALDGGPSQLQLLELMQV